MSERSEFNSEDLTWGKVTDSLIANSANLRGLGPQVGLTDENMQAMDTACLQWLAKRGLYTKTEAEALGWVSAFTNMIRAAKDILYHQKASNPKLQTAYEFLDEALGNGQSHGRRILDQLDNLRKTWLNDREVIIEHTNARDGVKRLFKDVGAVLGDNDCQPFPQSLEPSDDRLWEVACQRVMKGSDAARRWVAASKMAETIEALTLSLPSGSALDLVILLSHLGYDSEYPETMSYWTRALTNDQVDLEEVNKALKDTAGLHSILYRDFVVNGDVRTRQYLVDCREALRHLPWEEHEGETPQPTIGVGDTRWRMVEYTRDYLADRFKGVPWQLL